jgi:hypothetical protein
MLGGLVNQSGALTAQDVASVLDAVHVEDGGGWTIESLVADLPNGIVYLYYFHQFDQPVVLNVSQEIASGRAGGPLSNLFPESVKQEAIRRYEHIQSQKSRYDVFGKVWLGLAVASLTALLIGSIKGRKGWIFWIPVVVILGPLGLLIWLAAGHERSADNWQTLLVEAAGDVMPTIVAFMVFAIVTVLIPAVQASQIFQALLIFGSPLFIGWLVFQGPLLAQANHKDYLHTLIERLPHAWVTANLGMGGIFVLATPLANGSVQNPLPFWTFVAWWAFAVAGALVAMLLLLLYEVWSVRRGFRAWSVLACGEGLVTSAPWRMLWWWILLSYLAFMAGIVGYPYIQQIKQR